MSEKILKELTELCLLKKWSLRELQMPSRKPVFVGRRAVAVHCLRRLGYSWSTIGRALSRDHSTVIHLFNKFDEQGEPRK